MKAELALVPTEGAEEIRSERPDGRKTQDKRDPRLPIADLFSEERARQLWDSLPYEHRQDHFDASNMPDDYRRAFVEQVNNREKGWFTQAITFSGLPEPMIYELAWFVDQ